MVVVAIIAILVTMARPDQSPKIIKAQVVESLGLVAPYKSAIGQYYQLKGKFPNDNEELGVDEANRIIGNYMVSATIDNGAIHIEFGNKAQQQIQSKILSLRPVFVADAQTPISWVCGDGEVPAGMMSTAPNRSDIEAKFLPLLCR